jgi:hypothetical protein
MIIPQQDLAKFGYRLDMKVKEFRNIFIFWLPTGTCCRNLVIKNNSEIWQIRAIFMANAPFMDQKHIFRGKNVKIHPKKNTGWSL